MQKTHVAQQWETQEAQGRSPSALPCSAHFLWDKVRLTDPCFKWPSGCAIPYVTCPRLPLLTWGSPKWFLQPSVCKLWHSLGWARGCVPEGLAVLTAIALCLSHSPDLVAACALCWVKLQCAAFQRVTFPHSLLPVLRLRQPETTNIQILLFVSMLGECKQTEHNKGPLWDTKPFCLLCFSVPFPRSPLHLPPVLPPLQGCQVNSQIPLPWFWGVPGEVLQSALVTLVPTQGLDWCWEWCCWRSLRPADCRRCCLSTFCLLLGCCPPAAEMMLALSRHEHLLLEALSWELKGFAFCPLGEGTSVMNFISGEAVQLFLFWCEYIPTMNLFCCSSPSGQVMMLSNKHCGFPQPQGLIKVEEALLGFVPRGLEAQQERCAQLRGSNYWPSCDLCAVFKSCSELSIGAQRQNVHFWFI